MFLDDGGDVADDLPCGDRHDLRLVQLRTSCRSDKINLNSPDDKSESSTRTYRNKSYYMNFKHKKSYMPL